MPVQSCPQKITCGDCLDFPIENFSAEAADQPTFVSVKNFVDDPKLGNIWNRTGCIGICFSTASQAAADECALQQAQLCTVDDEDCAGDICGDWGNPVPGDGFTPRTVFSSNEQECGITCPEPDGTPSSFTLPAGAVISTISQADADIRALALCMKRAAAGGGICFTTDLGCCLNEPIDLQIEVSGGTGPFSFVIIDGALPVNLALFPDGRIFGTAFLSGTFPVTIQVTDSSSPPIQHQKEFQFRVLDIQPDPLPNGGFGSPYSETLFATAAIAPFFWTVIAGALPAGLTLDSSTGILSGTPTSIGVSSFTIQITDKIP